MEFGEGKAKGVAALEVRTAPALSLRCCRINALISTRYATRVSRFRSRRKRAYGPVYGQPVPGQFSRSVTGGMLLRRGF